MEIFPFAGETVQTEDGFCMMTRCLSQLLSREGITTFTGDDGKERLFDYYFDDWFLYAIPGPVYGLVKMREQEFDARQGRLADGDTPGITVSFVSLNLEPLENCLREPSGAQIASLVRELDRVTSCREARHDPRLKAYFVRPQAQAPYLIAELYVGRMVSFGTGSVLALTENSRRQLTRNGRLRRFLTEINSRAGRKIWDGDTLRFSDVHCLTPEEKQAVLAVHTGNFSCHSFAAEVRFHAWFLFPLARLTLPGLNRSLYMSAIRADMSLNRGYQGPMPYYRAGSRWVKTQKRAHPDQKW